jgi:hypothetical protein
MWLQEKISYLLQLLSYRGVLTFINAEQDLKLFQIIDMFISSLHISSFNMYFVYFFLIYLFSFIFIYVLFFVIIMPL